MKAISASKLSTLYESAAVHLEESITDGRIADVVIEFETPQSPFGKGIACEVQHKHEEKETGQVTHAYLENGYSVLWAYESDFDFEEVDFNIPDHRFIRVWPNAVPEPKGRDLYPDSIPDRVRSDLQRRDGPGQVPAKFPPIIRTVHQFDIRSPVHGETNPEWEIYDKRKVHGVGHEQAWTIIYGHSALGSLFEIREIHRKENRESHLPLPIAPQDAPRFNRFCEAAHSNIEDNDVPHVDGEWKTCCMVELSYNAGLQGRIFFGTGANGEMQIVFNQYDIFGCLRRHRLDYRDGDFQRLGAVSLAISNVCPPQYPLKGY